MPITSQQANTGTVSAQSSISVTLPDATVAGNTLTLRITCSSTIILPSGFTKDTPAATGQGIYRKTAADGETSWTVTAGSAVDWAWHAEEFAGIDTDFPVDVVPVSAGGGNSTGTTPSSTTYDGVALAMHRLSVAGGTPATMSGHTNGFEEQAEVSVVGATNSLTISASQHPVQSIGTWSSTVTPTSGTATGLIVVYTAAGAKREADLQVHAGFEWGTASGIATAAGQSPFDQVTGTPAIVSTNPRTGVYCLELSGSAAAENLTWISGTGALGAGASFGVLRVCVLFPSSLPGGDLELCSLETTSQAKLTLRYRTSGTKLTLQVSTGTEVDGPIVTADTWYGIDLRLDARTTTYKGDWQVDGADQAQATGASTADLVSVVRLGWVTAATATVRYDDVAVSKIAGHYPFGDVQVRLLKPEATLTISGTAGNFALVTANATGGAFDAATALTNISELPPTVGAGASGFCQTAIATADYVNIPMETYQAAPDGAVRAVRMYACGWAASTTAATIGFRLWDGTAETALYAAADPGFDNAATEWVCKSRKSPSAAKITWDQAKLDALAYRVGFSGDATPDIGIHAIYAEAAVRVDPTVLRVASVQMVEGRDDLVATVDTRLDPDSLAPLGYDATAPAGGGDAVVDYVVSGSPVSTTVADGTTETEIVDAGDISAVTQVGIRPAVGAPDG